MVKKIMQVILIKDVNKIGKQGQLKSVADGFALNYLIPQGLAVKASQAKLNEVEAEAKKAEVKLKQEKDRLRELANKLNGLELAIKAKVSEGGKLFAGLAETDIARALKDKKIELDQKFIKIKKHIKDIGEHQVEIDFGGGLKAELKVKVAGE